MQSAVGVFKLVHKVHKVKAAFQAYASNNCILWNAVFHNLNQPLFNVSTF